MNERMKERKREAHLEDGRQQDPDSRRKNQFPREGEERRRREKEKGRRRAEIRVKPKTGMTCVDSYMVCMGGESVACLSLVLQLMLTVNPCSFPAVFTPLPSPGIFLQIVVLSLPEEKESLFSPARDCLVLFSYLPPLFTAFESTTDKRLASLVCD